MYEIYTLKEQRSKRYKGVTSTAAQVDSPMSLLQNPKNECNYWLNKPKIKK